MRSIFSMVLNMTLSQISMARHYSTLNISETVEDRDIVTMEY